MIPLRKYVAIVILSVLVIGLKSGQAASGFEVRGIEVYKKPPENKAEGIWVFDPAAKSLKRFIPCIKAQVKANARTKSTGMLAKAYFFSGEGKLIAGPVLPGKALRGNAEYAMPAFFEKEESLFFPIPEKIMPLPEFSVVVVFGNRGNASALGWPEKSVFKFEFPEKGLLNKMPGTESATAPERVFEHVVTTNNSLHPKITLFLRLPKGVKGGAEAKGVMAMCLLAKDANEIRLQLEGVDPSMEMRKLANFADQQKLAIICWGARVLWKPGASYDELERQTNNELDRSFNLVSNAWERGIVELHDRYGVPDRNFLLWGTCAAAQWAHRLALRKSDRFQAIYIHMPSSFDRPTAEGANLLWLLTVGELDSGYERGARFFAACKDQGYPMIFKGVVGLGHAGSPTADDLGLALFEYALSVRGKKIAWEEFKADSMLKNTGAEPEDWRKGFVAPEFFGDYLNQTLVPAGKENQIPAAFRVSLPNKKIAEAWAKEPQ